MDIHGKSVDMDGKFHINGKPDMKQHMRLGKQKLR